MIKFKNRLTLFYKLYGCVRKLQNILFCFLYSLIDYDELEMAKLKDANSFKYKRNDSASIQSKLIKNGDNKRGPSYLLKIETKNV